MVDLGDYIDQIRAQVNPPGVDLFPDATDIDWIDRLSNAFWDARIQGVTALDAWTEADGVITPQASTTGDITRDLLQLIIAWAAFRAVVSQLSNVKSQFRAQAGNVTFEQQQSATLLKNVLDFLVKEKDLILTRLSDVGTVPTFITDGIIASDEAMRDNIIWFVGG